MDRLPFYREFGEPLRRGEFASGTLTIWFKNPITLTRVEGHADRFLASAMDEHYKEIYPHVSYVVTFHDWSRLTDYDAECRKIVQRITHYVHPKRRELLIHLGPATGLSNIAVRVAAETISKLKRTPIEIFSSDDTFASRAEEILLKYSEASRANAE